MHFLGRGHSLNARIFNKKQPFLCKHKGLFFIAYSALISLLSRRLLDDCSNTSRSYCTATLAALESCFLWCSPCFLWLKSVFFRQFSSWYFYLPEFLAPFWHRSALFSLIQTEKSLPGKSPEALIQISAKPRKCHAFSRSRAFVKCPHIQ